MRLSAARLIDLLRNTLARPGKSAQSCASGDDCRRKLTIWQRISDSTPRVKLLGGAFCCPECLERELLRRLRRPSTVSDLKLTSHRRMPLGLLMLSRGELTAEQLRLTLELQKRKGKGRIGEYLQQLGYAGNHAIAAALAGQWSCPVIKTIPRGVGRCSIPFYLLRRFRMAPVHFSKDRRLLHLACAEKIEYRALLAIEQVLDCKTEPCLTTPDELEVALARLHEQIPRCENLFEHVTDAEEMTRTICSYVSAMGATELRVTSCGELFWARLLRGELSADLLFSHTAENSSKFMKRGVLGELSG